MLMGGRVRNQMSAELLEVEPGAGQIEPSATGAHTAQQPIWNQSLNTQCASQLCVSSIASQDAQEVM